MWVSMGLPYLSTSHFLNALHRMVFDLCFIAWHWKLSEVCKCVVQPNFERGSNVANAFENNYCALESVSNGLTNVVPYFKCIFDVSLWTGFSLIGSHVYRLTHPTETAILGEGEEINRGKKWSALWTCDASFLCSIYFLPPRLTAPGSPRMGNGYIIMFLSYFQYLFLAVILYC